jgi:biotin carboxyl carrier protein
MKKNIKWFIIGLALTLALTSSMTVFADNQSIQAFFNDIKMTIDGKSVQMDTEPLIYNGRTYVPVRFIAWRMLVSPAKGTFRQKEGLPEGGLIEPDTTVGAVASLRDETPVNAPHGGTIVEWLVHDGDLVSPGQPLVRLHPEGVA